MEILGAVASGVTLAVLFKHSFEAFDLIHLYQTQDVDFNLLQLQFKLERGRLYNWGDVMGLTDDSKKDRLSEWHSKDLVSETLRQIIDLFSHANVIRKKYGCDNTQSLLTPLDRSDFTSAFGHFEIHTSELNREQPSPFKKAKWVIRDRKKFLILISEVRSLIDSLENITNDLSTTARLEEFFRIRIMGLTDVDTLLGIGSVWKDSHPRVASAASTKADSLSVSSETYESISHWQTTVNSEASGDTRIADVEDLTITELKHSVISSNLEVEELKTSLVSTSQSIISLQQQIYVLKTDNNQKKSYLNRIDAAPRGDDTFYGSKPVSGVSYLSQTRRTSENRSSQIYYLELLMLLFRVIVPPMEIVLAYAMWFSDFFDQHLESYSITFVLLISHPLIITTVYTFLTYLWFHQMRKAGV